MFEGFPAAGLDLLASLPTRDKPWFQAHQEQYRADVAEPAKAFVEALGERLQREASSEIAGDGLKRVPAPDPADHPRHDLLRHKMIQIRWPEPHPKSIGSARFTEWCSTRMRYCSDVHRWLVANL